MARPPAETLDTSYPKQVQPIKAVVSQLVQNQYSTTLQHGFVSPISCYRRTGISRTIFRCHERDTTTATLKDDLLMTQDEGFSVDMGWMNQVRTPGSDLELDMTLLYPMHTATTNFALNTGACETFKDPWSQTGIKLRRTVETGRQIPRRPEGWLTMSALSHATSLTWPASDSNVQWQALLPF